MLETITDVSQTSTDPLSIVFTNCGVHPKLFHRHITYLCFICFDDFSSGLFFFLGPLSLCAPELMLQNTATWD